MKIQLKNFRCHRKASFEIPDEGLILLLGDSGAGKSTIFNAILYAFYGKVKKPYTHGTTTCSVTLEYKDLLITRTNRPNRLIVVYDENEYEDTPAQGVIETYLGMTYEEFSCSSYVVQSLRNSVISLTPSEQVKFVEILAFDDNLHNKYKEDIKQKIKEYEADMSSLTGQISLLEKQISDKKVTLPNEDVFEDMKNVDMVQMKKKVKSNQAHLAQLTQKMKDLEKKRKKAETLEKEKEELRTLKEKLETELSLYKSSKAKLKDEVPEKTLSNMEDKLEDLSTELFNTSNYEKYKEKLKLAENIYNEYKKELNEQYEEIEKQFPSDEEWELFWDNYETLDRRRKQYEEENQKVIEITSQKEKAQKTFEEILSKVKKNYSFKKKTSKSLLLFLKKKKNESLTSFEEMKKMLMKLEVSHQTFTCPSCDTSLFLREDALHILDDSVKISEKDVEQNTTIREKEIDSLKKDIDKLNRWIMLLEEIIPSLSLKIPKITVEYDPEEIDKIHSQAALYRNLDEKSTKLIEEMEQKKPPTKIQKYYDEAEMFFEQLPKKFKPKKSYSELSEEVNNLTKKIDNAKKTNSEHISLGREISVREKKLNTIDSDLGKSFLPQKNVLSLEKIKKEYEKSQKSFMKYTQQMNKNLEIVEALKKYDDFLQQKKILEKLELDQNEKEEELEDVKQLYQGMIGLKEATLEAEIKALECTVESINEHASFYLDKFFEEKIVVRLNCSKMTTKKVRKTQLNTYIEYKGHKYSHVDELSGGEVQRCELAFLLAVHDMVCSKILLLDECLNSLDASVNMKVLSFLKDLDKHIIVISHEAIPGIFDNITKI